MHVKSLSLTQQEFDNYAEWDLKDIDFVDDDSDILRGEALFFLWGSSASKGNPLWMMACGTSCSVSALKLSVVDIYHSRLKERQRRKK